MFWGAISRSSKVFLEYIPESITAEVDCDFLKSKTLPALKTVHKIGYLFQQDYILVRYLFLFSIAVLIG